MQYRVAYVVLGTDAAAQQTSVLAQAVRGRRAAAGGRTGEVWQKGVETLQAQNRDCPRLGLYSADTGLISVPVMYTPQQPEYYLRRDFEEQYSLAARRF